MDFIILKVNSKDLTNASHEETVRALNSAAEPIIVELARRSSAPTKTETSDSKHKTTTATTTTTSTQTDPIISSCCCPQTLTFPAPPPLYSCDEDDYNIYCNSEIADFQVQEYNVSLRRTSNKDKIGLTLCYGEPIDDEVYDVFVRSVDDESLASKDGRIQEGDQILKINDQPVRNRQEAIQLFSENRSDINLLIRRAVACTQMEDILLEGEYQCDSASLPLITEESSDYEDDSTITDTATLPSHREKDDKDSGVGHDSSHCSEQECDSCHYDTLCSKDDPELHPEELIETHCTQFRQLLEARCMNVCNESIELLCEQLDKDLQRSVPKMGTRVKLNSGYENSLTRSESQDTAYSTAESCDSNHTTLALNKTLSGSTLSLSERKQSKPEEKERKKSRKSGKSKKSIDNNSLDIAYTTENQLAEMMASQQRILLQHSRTSTIKQESNSQTGNMSDSSNMEWVVKRRADGSRYITKRPIRAKLLNDRKKKLEDERCGMTTDDDAMSEMKTGRHWSKEDRRRHLQKAREYHQRKQFMQQKLEALKKASVDEHSNIIELSQQKIQKYTMKDLGFLTVPELLAHQGRFPLNSSNVFSVTTV